jgi:hypothetical protein
MIEKKELETWENVTRGKVSILKYDQLGKEYTQLVAGGRKFSLTREERVLNQDRAANEELDIFQNGTLNVVRLLDGDEDGAMFANNPNMMAESDINELFKVKSVKAFEAKLGEVTNLNTLERIREVADGLDNVTVRQIAAIEDRIEAVTPRPEIPGMGKRALSDDVEVPKAVTPK